MTLKSDTAHEGTIGCPRCKIAMEEVARIKPLRKVEGLIAYACPSRVKNNLALKLPPWSCPCLTGHSAMVFGLG
jgi:hypothetical protein